MQNLKHASPVHPVLTVSEFTNQIRDILEEVFETAYVVGEVSNAKVYSSGHWYFSLKDKDATLPCVCFKANNSNLKFKLEDGLMIVARGKLNVYPPRGAYQMIVSSLEPVGIGDWQLAFEQLKEKLDKEGLLAPERKRPIPMMPRRIGVVTSTAGAALRDILSALERRNRSVNVLISPAKVQGEGSAEEVARAIEYLQSVNDIDVIIVARGGGSIEDLWSFNTEIVARAVANSRIPIISGVGHETDITICDLVADLRAPTPTAAAELVARGSAELLERYSNLERRMLSVVQEKLFRARRSLDKLNPVNSLLRYHERLQRHHLKITNYRELMIRRIEQSLSTAHYRWHKQHEKLGALGPLNVMSRGFSIIRNVDGAIVQSAQGVQAGDVLEALLLNGRLKVRVEEIMDDWLPKNSTETANEETNQ